MSPRRLTRAGAALLGSAALLGMGGCGAGVPGPSAAPPTTAPSTTAPSTTAPSTTAPPSSAPSSSVPPLAGATTAPAVDGGIPARGGGTGTPDGLRPVRLEIPAIGVASDIGDLGVAPDGTVQVPADPMRAGWFSGGPAPGQQGPAVLLGHVDSHTGPAVFARLGQLKRGDAVVVTRQDGTQARFTVDGTMTYAKSAFPTEATYGPVPGPVLRLVTCGGEYVRGQGGYQSNVVVFAS